jgi:hypothetical protein
MVDEEPNKKINENNRRRVKNMKSLLCYTDVKIIYFNMKWEIFAENSYRGPPFYQIQLFQLNCKIMLLTKTKT